MNILSRIKRNFDRVVGSFGEVNGKLKKKATLFDAQRLAAIVSGSDDAIISKTLDGIITSWNGGATRIFGYTSREMIGRSIDRIIPFDLRGEEREIIAKLTRGERIDHFDTIRLAKDARRVAVSVTVSPLRGAFGTIVGASKVARDITDRRRGEAALRDANEAMKRALVDVADANRGKETEASERRAAESLVKHLQTMERAFKKSEERFRLAVESAPNAIVMIDSAGLIEMVNAQAERLFGYPRTELLGRSVDMLVPERSRNHPPGPPAAFLLDPPARSTEADRDLFGLRKDGSEFSIDIGLNPIETAEGAAMVLVGIVDISARKQADAALRNANERAQQARIEAEKANQAKTDFLAVMSHEIRTPLTCISGYVDMLTFLTTLTPQQRRYAELVKAANAALLTIVNDILDFSKVEAGQMELDLRLFSLSALVRDTVEIVAPAAAGKSLSLSYTLDRGVPEWVMGDHARLRQVLLNLLNNASKFTYKGSVIVDARMHVAKDGRERIRFSVTDTGVGVPAEQQHRLFKQFSQADSSVSRQHGGTGLGLAISKRLVELMEGEIGIVSELGQGSTVWFTALMPGMAEPAPEPRFLPSENDFLRETARILVIDDIDTNLEIVEAYLQDRSYQVDCAKSGLEAIEMLGRKRYDLVLMDIQMPIMDGITATKCIRGLTAAVRDIPIIAMTGNVLPQQVRSFLEAGMNDHVGKPIERAKLYANVRRWLPRGGKAERRFRIESATSESPKFEDFVLAVGSEKAERIAQMFLMSLTEAFKSSPAEALLEAHGLLNTAGVLGLDDFVETCRHAAELASSPEPDRTREMLGELRRAQSVARYTLTSHLLPNLRGESLFAA